MNLPWVSMHTHRRPSAIRCKFVMRETYVMSNFSLVGIVCRPAGRNREIWSTAKIWGLPGLRFMLNVWLHMRVINFRIIIVLLLYAPSSMQRWTKGILFHAKFHLDRFTTSNLRSEKRKIWHILNLTFCGDATEFKGKNPYFVRD